MSPRRYARECDLAYRQREQQELQEWREHADQFAGVFASSDPALIRAQALGEWPLLRAKMIDAGRLLPQNATGHLAALADAIDAHKILGPWHPGRCPKHVRRSWDPEQFLRSVGYADEPTLSEMLGRA